MALLHFVSVCVLVAGGLTLAWMVPAFMIDPAWRRTKPMIVIFWSIVVAVLASWFVFRATDPFRWDVP